MLKFVQISTAVLAFNIYLFRCRKCCFSGVYLNLRCLIWCIMKRFSFHLFQVGSNKLAVNSSTTHSSPHFIINFLSTQTFQDYLSYNSIFFQPHQTYQLSWLLRPSLSSHKPMQNPTKPEFRYSHRHNQSICL